MSGAVVCQEDVGSRLLIAAPFFMGPLRLGVERSAESRALSGTIRSGPRAVNQRAGVQTWSDQSQPDADSIESQLSESPEHGPAPQLTGSGRATGATAARQQLNARGP